VTGLLAEPGFLVAVAVLLLLLALWRDGQLRGILGGVAATLLGLIYVCGPFALARELHLKNPHWLFFVLVLNWVGDAAALYVGRAIGRHKLAPEISPNKTWEGTVASTLAALPVGAWYLLHFQPAPVSLGKALALAAGVNIAAQLGDLAESGFKRGADLKDSSRLLPGHGGMLDRVDGLLFSIPACYFFVVWITGYGG
jgi:phosphatidate cytidylyltransferase